MDNTVNREFDLYKDIQMRTGGEIYMGVIGPVRTGKSTLIKRIMDVLVLPSYREGFGNIVIEAEAMGLPVIVSDIPGPTDAMVQNETGLVVPVKDVDALAEAMTKLIADATLRETYGAAGQAFASSKFEQKKLTEHILEDRKKLLEKVK